MPEPLVKGLMKFTQLGEFEELVLLIIGSLGNDAYSISIKQALKDHTKRNPSIGALHSAFNRLEKKGFLESYEGGATNKRGGRSKRFYTLTAYGRKALDLSYEVRSQLYHTLPQLGLTNE